jgi:hypothetical protein
MISLSLLGGWGVCAKATGVENTSPPIHTHPTKERWLHKKRERKQTRKKNVNKDLG